MTDQADADAVAVVLDWLKQSTEAVQLVGGADQFGGVLRAPWPCVLVTEGPGGNLRDLRWTQDSEVILEVVGSPDGFPGDAALRRAAVRLARIVADLPEQQPVDAHTPVVSLVKPSGTAYQQTRTTGQRRFAVGLMVTLRPPDIA